MTKRTLPSFLFLLFGYFFLCSVAPPLHAQSSDWAELPLPGTGNISVLYANGNLVLAARGVGLRNTGVYRSTDAGQSWAAVAGFETNTDGSIVGCFVAANNALYATGRGVRRPNDGGLTWTPLNNGLTVSFLPGVVAPIGCLAVNGETLVATAGAPYQAVFLSTDGGASWRERPIGLPVGTNFTYGPVAFSEGDVLLWVISQFYRYRADTGGWVRVSPPNGVGYPFRDRNSFVARGKNLFMIGRENNPPQQVFRSIDGGTSWAGFMRGLPANQIAGFSKVFDLVSERALLYASATAGESLTMPSPTSPGNVYFSDDDGETWAVATKPLALANDLIRQNFSYLFAPITVSGANIYAANVDKLYRTTLLPPTVSAASYRALDVASGSIAAIFGNNLTTSAALPQVESDAPATQLPSSQLADVMVQVTDSAGRQRNAFLFAATPPQINFQIPPETAPGLATVNLGGTNQVWHANIATVAPSLFTAEANGSGLPAGVALRVKADGTQSFEALFQYDAQNRPVALPLEVNRTDETVFLVLFVTGMRGRSELAKVTATVGGLNVPVEYAGPVDGLVGLDQLNLRLPRALAGRGEVAVEVQADGKRANPVRMLFK
ncbi:MAG: hypothetical protein HYR56_05080 [Acidobacteria bacterium]|nr:hypothetical protein [Acidobacteriota bacterium]MBI3427664.1 hypothetical protein [Acidobacteriota bacterium]